MLTSRDTHRIEPSDPLDNLDLALCIYAAHQQAELAASNAAKATDDELRVMLGRAATNWNRLAMKLEREQDEHARGVDRISRVRNALRAAQAARIFDDADSLVHESLLVDALYDAAGEER